jgi:hypothetical protein
MRFCADWTEMRPITEAAQKEREKWQDNDVDSDNDYDYDNNKKFWEELIAYFPRYDTGHIKNDAPNNLFIVACVFVTAVTFLPSRCLATIGDTYTDTQTDGRDFLIRPLRWAQVPWYTYQVS